jgi:hypothetical protein
VKRDTKPARTLAGALLVGALGLPAAACSGGGGDQAAAEPAESAREEGFCSAAQQLYDQFTQANVSDPTSPEARRVYERAQRLEPPSEIAEAWEQSMTVLGPIVRGEVDMNDPAQVAEVGEQAAEIDGELLETYFAEACPVGRGAAAGASAGATATTATTAAAG